jgi:hypothetical protein
MSRGRKICFIAAIVLAALPSLGLSFFRKRNRNSCGGTKRRKQRNGAMKGDGGRSTRRFGNRRLFAASAFVAIAIGFLTIVFALPAQALPSSPAALVIPIFPR